MHIFIQQTLLKLIIFLSILSSCNSSERFSDYQKGEITLNDGTKLETILAITPEQQELGLSQTKPEQFSDTQVMLFTSETQKMRQFWMPETHFNLDIIFLTEDLYVLDIHRNVPAYPKRKPRYMVPLSKRVMCTHVLEIKNTSPHAQKIKIGQILKWTSTKSLSQILQGTH